MSARLPTAFESAVKTMITNSITAVYNESAAASIVTTTHRIEADPTTWSSFSLARKIG
jgi:hypothetical protein